MRRLPIALAGASLIAAGLVAGTAHGSTPSSTNLVVPTSPNQSASTTWTGTIPVGANGTNDCSAQPTNLSDSHTLNLTAPSYDGLKAVFGISIDWTYSGVPQADDEIVSLIAPDGSTIGSADNSQLGDGSSSEILIVNNLPSGKYTVLACGFSNIAPKAYTGKVAVKTTAVPKVGKAGAGLSTINDKTMTFAPSTIVDPILFGGEPGFTFDPTVTNGSREFVDWPVSSRTNIGVLFRSTDGGLSFQKRYSDTADPSAAGPLCLGRQVPYCPTGGGGDTDTNINPTNGNLYFSSQEALADEASGTSLDHGTTFPADHADPVTHKTGSDVDRQWLGSWKGTNTVFLAYHTGVVGAYIARSDQAGATGSWSLPTTPQVPFVAQSGALEVDNTGGVHNHALYLSYLSDIPTGTLSLLDTSPHVAVSTDGAQTFKRYPLPKVMTNGVQDSAYNFVKLHLDNAGNAYAVWTDSTNNATYLATSKATASGNLLTPGKVWKGPYQISTSPADLSIFPDVRAGSPGRIAVIYYGTHANAGKPDDVKPGDGGWYPFVSFSDNALCGWDSTPCKSPTFHQTTTTAKMVQDDNICTSGTACAATMGNRALLDYWDIDVDRNGHLGFVWSDTTNAIGAPFVRVTRQISGPSLYAGKPNATGANRGNGYPDPAGDAIFPFSGKNVLTAPNHPTLDLRGTTAYVNGSNLEFKINLASAANLGAGVPTGHDGLTPLQQAKYLVRWDFGKDAYYAAANVPAGGTPTYFSGKVSTAEGIVSPTNPDSLFLFGNTYSLQGPAAGHISGNTMVIDVPLSAVGSPKRGSHLVSVGSYTLVGARDQAVILETLPLTVDSTPTFDTNLAAAPGSTTGQPDTPGSGNGRNSGGRLATTGAPGLLAGSGVVLLLFAAWLGRRRRTT